jgi:RNA-directed DNA polymerase
LKSAVSPLLANIGLHGLEEFVKNLETTKVAKNGRKYKKNPKLGIIRYADDFVVTSETKEDAEFAKAEIERWMKERRLELSAEKTRIVHIDEGFDFLGFNVRRYSGKLIIKPQKEKVLKFCQRIGEEIRAHHGMAQETLIRRLNPILRGFVNYYRFVCSKEIFNYIGHRVWQYLWRWSVRQHPNKGKKWVRDKYFHSERGRNWIFRSIVKFHRVFI